MFWNHRLIKHDNYVAIHEVFYENNKIVGWTKEPISLIADDKEEIYQLLKQIDFALSKDTLNIKELEKEYEDG